MSDITEKIRSFWDIDAATYDDSPGHHPRSPVVRAAWSAAIRRLLPAPPARVLDVGAGTGFLAILLAQLGYAVTALDVAPQMLARLEDKAMRAGLGIRVIEGDASAPPHELFDVVVERHLLWTMLDPSSALNAWRQASPNGQLVLFESEWGQAGRWNGAIRAKAREALRAVRKEQPEHHEEYEPQLRAQLPLGRGTTPESLISLVEGSAWGAARIECLRDIDWATRRALPTVVDRVIGVPPRFAIIAG